MQHDIQMIMIDYLQLMTTSESSKIGNREQEISTISRALKSIAKELNVPIIALSQLSRKVEDRGASKKPMLSDLRESGAIEQDADMVVFLYRPEYYNLDQDEDGNSMRGIAQVIIAKHRNGSLIRSTLGSSDSTSSLLSWMNLLRQKTATFVRCLISPAIPPPILPVDHAWMNWMTTRTNRHSDLIC